MNNKSESQEWSTSVEKVISLFRSIHKIFRKHMVNQARKYGFTGPQMILIHILCKKPFITLHELSGYMGLSKSTVSGIVDRLVTQGVVVREIPEDNRRTVRLSLSPDFLVEKKDLIEVRSKYFTDIFKDTDVDDIEKIICGLEKLHTFMGQNIGSYTDNDCE